MEVRTLIFTLTFLFIVRQKSFFATLNGTKKRHKQIRTVKKIMPFKKFEASRDFYFGCNFFVVDPAKNLFAALNGTSKAQTIGLTFFV